MRLEPVMMAAQGDEVVLAGEPAGERRVLVEGGDVVEVALLGRVGAPGVAAGAVPFDDKSADGVGRDVGGLFLEVGIDAL